MTGVALQRVYLLVYCTVIIRFFLIFNNLPTQSEALARFTIRQADNFTRLYSVEAHIMHLMLAPLLGFLLRIIRHFI